MLPDDYTDRLDRCPTCDRYYPGLGYMRECPTCTAALDTFPTLEELGIDQWKDWEDA